MATIGHDLAKIAFAAQRCAAPKRRIPDSYLVWGAAFSAYSKASSSEVDAGSREENASAQESRALIPSESEL
jgi:hypothetical protein